MQNLCYQLKVIPAFNSNIYRLLELDGSCTFAALSDLILDAFEFDHDHLYMFSLGRKPYDPNGIYSPGGRAENVRTGFACRMSIRLKEINTFIYIILAMNGYFISRL